MKFLRFAWGCFLAFWMPTMFDGYGREKRGDS